ncbi:MAG: MerR family transcriptional regulator [Eubacterium sp.]|nr:MerR family transcriptional regulator [Eubacterium sp.]
MITIKKLSDIAGVSVRTLQYYDKIGLLKPSDYTESGYRLYSEQDAETLQYILLFKELEFSLQDIKAMIKSADFDKKKAIEQQIELLTLKREHLDNLILFAKGLKLVGVNYMDFRAFDKRKIDEYAKQARESWCNTEEFKEFEEKNSLRSDKENRMIEKHFMMIFAEFGMIKEKSYESDEAQALVKKLQDFITDKFYTCNNKILSLLGKMYAGGGDFTENIDAVGGEGTSEFVNKAIEYYCR